MKMHLLARPKERGIVHIPILIAAIALIGFILVSSSAEFKNKLFSRLFPKPPSHAAEGDPGSVRFVDSSGNTITATSSVTVKVKYVLPNVGGSTNPVSFSIVKQAKAQTIGVGSTSPTGGPTPSPSASPTSDGSFCEGGDSDYNTKGTCRDAEGTYTDYCEGSTVRSWYCTGTWNGTSWSNRHCAAGGYVCSSGGKVCSDGACVVPSASPPPPTPIPTHTPTAIPVTFNSVVLAEDNSFTTNVKSVGVGSTNPVDYTFSSSTPGTKNLYVKFITSLNQHINATPFPATIQLVASSPTPSGGTGSGYQRVFVTSTRYNGNLGGLSGADDKCQRAANSSTQYPDLKNSSWKAWLSDSTTSAASRLTPSNIPYKLLNGTTIANNLADLTDGYIEGSIRVTEQSTIVSGGNVWTNTTTRGLIDSSNANENCNNWTSQDGLIKGKMGNTTIRNSEATWTSGGISGCGNTAHLYCFEQTSVTSSPTPTPTNQKPIVNTLPASNIGYTSAMLRGSVNPNGLNTVGWFRFSSTNPGSCNNTFGNKAPFGTINNALGAATSFVGYAAATSIDLSSSTTYYYCAIASNSAGMAFGNIQQFRTSGSTPTPNYDACRLDMLNGQNITRDAINDRNQCLSRICDRYGPSNASRGIASKCIFLGQEIKRYNVSTPTPRPTSTSGLFSSPTPTSSLCTACRADINRNGGVNIVDYSYLISCYNRRADQNVRGRPCAPADINGDGAINGGDFTCLTSKFGQACQ